MRLLWGQLLPSAGAKERSTTEESYYNLFPECPSRSVQKCWTIKKTIHFIVVGFLQSEQKKGDGPADGEADKRRCHPHGQVAGVAKSSLFQRPSSLEHSSLPKAKSKPRHRKHYHRAFHSTLFQISHFGRFSAAVPRTLSRLALHRQIK